MLRPSKIQIHNFHLSSSKFWLHKDPGGARWQYDNSRVKQGEEEGDISNWQMAQVWPQFLLQKCQIIRAIMKGLKPENNSDLKTTVIISNEFPYIFYSRYWMIYLLNALCPTPLGMDFTSQLPGVPQGCPQLSASLRNSSAVKSCLIQVYTLFARKFTSSDWWVWDIRVFKVTLCLIHTPISKITRIFLLLYYKILKFYF